ncbi:hypothetical protein WJX81_001483 [Elliptochloris bilobata]|uniref:GPI mannosyltransferase I n=1 Tax=Elliptochloris bilobata TaxID=381761 RepID=A0AAW1RQ64_9CHLO
MYALPYAAADALGGLALAGLVHALSKQRRAPEYPGPAAAAAFYLWNPLAVAACCGGSSGGLEAAAALCALCATACKRPALAALALACAAHLTIHALLLLVPLAMLLIHGAEDLSFDPRPEACALRSRKAISLRRHACAGLAAGAACPAGQVGDPNSKLDPSQDFWGGAAPRHWVAETYGFALRAEDLEPNSGLHWYLAAQLQGARAPGLRGLRAPTRALLHLLAAGLAAPMALRLPRQPLLGFLVQAVATCLWHPYPSVSHVALYLALLPLFAVRLRRLQAPQAMALSFLVMAAVFPATWHLWAERRSGNANHLFAVTLLFGFWQVLLLVQLVTTARDVERLERVRSHHRA